MPESNIDPRQPTKPAPLTPAQNHWLSSITFIIDSMFPLKVECRTPPPRRPLATFIIGSQTPTSGLSSACSAPNYLIHGVTATPKEEWKVHRCGTQRTCPRLHSSLRSSYSRYHRTFDVLSSVIALIEPQKKKNVAILVSPLLPFHSHPARRPSPSSSVPRTSAHFSTTRDRQSRIHRRLLGPEYIKC